MGFKNFWKKYLLTHYLFYIFIISYLFCLIYNIVIFTNITNVRGFTKTLLYIKSGQFMSGLLLVDVQNISLFNINISNFKNYFLRVEHDVLINTSLNLFYCFDFYFMDMFIMLNYLNRNIDFYFFYNYLFVLFCFNIMLIYQSYKYF